MASATALRILITGATGFVGPHLAAAIRQRFDDRASITATALNGGADAVFGAIESLDVTDRAAVEQMIGVLQPTHVVNLAALAAPAAANADPVEGWRVHLDGPRNLGFAILATAPACMLINIGSGLAYGRSGLNGPATEQTLLAPTDDYGASKAAADLALGALVAKGLRCIRFRPFNHTGPGQTNAFVVPAFARQIAQIEAGLAPPLLRVGNLDGQRDFLDVRDVVTAYVEAIAHGDQLEPGLILNLASGIPRRIGEILEQLLALTPQSIDVQRDPARMRADVTDIMVGDATRARTLLNWKPTINFATTIADVLDDQRARIGRRAEPRF